MRRGIPWANDPCTKPQVYGTCGDPGEVELTLANDPSDSTSGNRKKAVSVAAVGQEKRISVSRLSVLWCLSIAWLCVQELKEKGMETANEQFEPHSQDVIAHASAIYLDKSSNKDFHTSFLCMRGALCKHS